jgi:hypothetical protein
VEGLQQLLGKLEGGGLLLIDEAYQLQPTKSQAGSDVVSYLIPEVENQRGRLVVVMTGEGQWGAS